MDGFQRRKENKKERIRKSAFDLFAAYGVKKVSVAEIADKADVSQVTIYNYFGSKDELFRDVAIGFFEEKWEEYRSFLQSELPFTEKVEGIIFDKVGVAKQLNKEFYQSFMSDDPVLTDYIEKFYNNRALPLLIDFINSGKTEGYVNKELSTESIIFYLNMFKEASYNTEIVNDPMRMSKDLTTLLFYGLIGG